MKVLFRLLFPLWYASRIPLTDEQKQLFNDDYDGCGADMVEDQYELKTGRSLFVDTLLSALLWALIFFIIAVI